MKFISNAIKITPAWATLKTIGQSRAAKLTTVAPFVGWIILLNASLTNLLTLSPELFSHNGGTDPGSLSKIFTMNSLYFTYIGLSIVGVASLMFIFSCPQVIKQEDSERSYVSAQSVTSTTAQIHYLSGIIAERYEVLENLRILATGRGSFFELWDTMISDMYHKGELEVGDGIDFCTPMDTPIIDRITKEIAVNRRASRALVETFRASAVERKSDIYSMYYKSENILYLKTRISICILYVIGFSILSVPTLRTFFKIITLAIA